MKYVEEIFSLRINQATKNEAIENHISEFVRHRKEYVMRKFCDQIKQQLERISYLTLACVFLVVLVVSLPLVASAEASKKELQKQLSGKLAFLTIRMPRDFYPAYRKQYFTTQDIAGIRGVVVEIRKLDSPKLFPEYSVFETPPLPALIYHKNEYGNLIPYPIIYDFSSSILTKDVFGEGDVFNIAVPSGEYFFGFRFRTRGGGIHGGLKGVYREGINGIRPSSHYDIVPLMP